MAKDIYIVTGGPCENPGYTEIAKALDKAERNAKDANREYGVYKLVALVSVKHVTQIHWQSEDRTVDLSEFDIPDLIEPAPGL